MSIVDAPARLRPIRDLIEIPRDVGQCVGDVVTHWLRRR